MAVDKETGTTSAKSGTTVERTSDRELTVTRLVNGPAHLVFKAWTTPELFKRWWSPRSSGVVMASQEMDIRVGGRYRLVFNFQRDGAPVTFAATGKYLEVTPSSRLVWTSDESEAGESISTATFEEQGGKTLLIVREVYPSKEALDAAFSSGGMVAGTRETFDQLDEFIVELAANA